MKALLGVSVICGLFGVGVCVNRFNYDEVSGKMTIPVERVPLFSITETGIHHVQEADVSKRQEDLFDIPRESRSNRPVKRQEDFLDKPFQSRHKRSPDVDFLEELERTARDDKKGRKRPKNDDVATVEMVIVADSSIYKRFREQNENEEKAVNALRLYYTLYAKLMDQWYGGLDEVEVRVQLVAILVSKTASTSQFVERIKGTNPGTQAPDEINASIGLRAFRDWLVVNMLNFSIQYDHAMLFTDYQMYRGAGHAASGLSFVGKICRTDRGWSASIMSEEGAFTGVYTSVHELTHNLGADHDGKTGESCRATDNMVMAPTNYFGRAVAKNYFLFSKCSQKAVKKNLKNTGVPCLYSTVRPSEDGRDEFQPPGLLMTVDQQCQDIIGNASSACQGAKYLRQRCYRLWCKKLNSRKCTTLGHTNAPYGTPCGEGKWCRLGECIPINS